MRAHEIVNGRFVTQVICEGGNAFDDVGTIHRDEIEPTLKAFADMVAMPELVNQTLGSVGKVEYSGDIDIAVNLDGDAMKELSHDLRNKLGNQSVTGVAGNVTVRFPISNYDESKDGRQPRTGKVQIDLIPGDPKWFKTYYHSPGDASKLKGIHRNLGLAMLAKNMDLENSKEEDDFGRPVKQVRWTFGQKNGLVKVLRKSVKSERTGKWIKKQQTDLVTDPLKDPAKIAEIMFRGKAGPEALNSLETILDAVKKAYSKKEQAAIFADMAAAFEDTGLYDVKTGFVVPKEIKQYLKGK